MWNNKKWLWGVMRCHPGPRGWPATARVNPLDRRRERGMGRGACKGGIVPKHTQGLPRPDGPFIPQTGYFSAIWGAKYVQKGFQLAGWPPMNIVWAVPPGSPQRGKNRGLNTFGFWTRKRCGPLFWLSPGEPQLRPSQSSLKNQNCDKKRNFFRW